MINKAREADRGVRGFSLAEVLVAVAIMSVIILALFGLVTAGVQRAYSGKKMTEAATIAESAMQRANIIKPQALLDGVDADTTKSYSWDKTALGNATASITPAVETGTTVGIIARNAWRTLLLNCELPATSVHPAKLTITMTPQPAGKNFGNASMVRIVVELEWWEWGTRVRRVRLQTLNMRVVPS
jgi:prepilin-type N-terminal cleavage/methylation domain-containing protein